MKKSINFLLILLFVILCNIMSVYADSKPVVMEIQDCSDTPVIYVKGINGEVKSASAVIENTECKNVRVDTFSDSGITLDTLIMVDNSLSVPKESRERIKNSLADLIADRKSYERFSIATYGETLESLIDFTDDYKSLKATLDNIEYRDRETYLTDVLYELVSSDSFKENEDGAYRRIIVISDGVDNKDVGYTSNELITLLKKTGIPVYSIGCYNGKKSNGNELSNMFSISRATNAEGVVDDNVETLFDSIRLDRNIVRFQIEVEDVLKDGTEKTVKLTFNDGTEQTVIADNVRMAQIVVSEKTEETKPTEVPSVAAPGKEKKAPAAEPSFFEKNKIIIFCGIGLAIVIVVLVVLLIVSVRKKRDAITYEDEMPLYQDEEETTVFLYDNAQDFDSDDKTVNIFPNIVRCRVLLQDIHEPAYSFEMPISTKLVIGRSANKGAEMVINYDKSISGRHCTIEKRGDYFVIKDENSANGTYVNGVRVSAAGANIIPGQTIKLGKTEFIFQVKL